MFTTVLMHTTFWMQKTIHRILPCPALLSEFSQAPKPSPVASRSIYYVSINHHIAVLQTGFLPQRDRRVFKVSCKTSHLFLRTGLDIIWDVPSYLSFILGKGLILFSETLGYRPQLTALGQGRKSHHRVWIFP